MVLRFDKLKLKLWDKIIRNERVNEGSFGSFVPFFIIPFLFPNKKKLAFQGQLWAKEVSVDNGKVCMFTYLKICIISFKILEFGSIVIFINEQLGLGMLWLDVLIQVIGLILSSVFRAVWNRFCVHIVFYIIENYFWTRIKSGSIIGLSKF